MFSFTADGLLRSTVTGSTGTTSATLPATSRAVTFRYTLWLGNVGGTCQAYDPVFGSRFKAPGLDPMASAVAIGNHGPFGPSDHSRVIGSLARFRSVACHRKSSVSFC